MTLPIATAQLDWKEDGSPVSTTFDDVYFSAHSGIDETRYVFLKHNALAERFRQAAATGSKIPVIGETGFGTGLNFLSAWQLRDEVAPGCRLQFVSLEKYPLTQGDLARACANWPELKPLNDQLVNLYPPATPGWHRISFIEAGVELNLYFGEALDALSSLPPHCPVIDAWFLDGFAPAKNPDMWRSELFDRLACLSNPDATFSTFTAAAIVREGLREAGFEVTRVKGYANKRHMLTGRLKERKPPTTVLPPWFKLPMPAPNKGHALVIGGGLAGTSAAFSLARRGWQVTLLEKNSDVAAEASGNPQGILYSKLSAEPSSSSLFYTAGYLYSLRQLQQLFPAQPEIVDEWHACGVLQLAHSRRELQRQQQFLKGNPQPEALVRPVNRETATRLSGTRCETGGLFFPGGGWARPSAISEKLAHRHGINLITGSPVHQLEHDGERWLALSREGKNIAGAEIAVIATAGAVKGFAQTRHLPVKEIRGQVSAVPATGEVTLKTVICGDAYIAPPLDGQYHMGATFNLDSIEPECRPSDHLANFEKISALVPELAAALKLKQLPGQSVAGRVGFRASTPDYLPIVGPVPDHAAFIEQFARLRNDAKTRFSASEQATWLPGLYVTTGHGSKGLTSCPLAGEILASHLCGEPPPLSQQLMNAINPARFIIRDLIRNRV